MFILLGFIFSKLDKNNFSKFLSFLILTIFLVGVLITEKDQIPLRFLLVVLSFYSLSII